MICPTCQQPMRCQKNEVTVIEGPVRRSGDLYSCSCGEWILTGMGAPTGGEDVAAAIQLALDWWNPDTQAFVAKYGAGMTSRQVCDHLRAALQSLR